ncbi:MAG: hypothetical protein L0Z70_09830, partial [Chloroflexi bacterium]|nr:hypothetical protein [Chloroflexota bacterium]
GEKGRSLRGEILRVVEASPQRINPPCPYYGQCGGCHYQHISYAAQVQAKKDILVEQIQRAAPGLSLPTVEALPSPVEYHYRNHAQFHMTPDGSLGYHRAGTNEVIPVKECLLLQTPLAETLPTLTFGPLPEIERVGLRAGADGEVQVTLEGSPESLPEVDVEESPVSVVHLSEAGRIVLAGGAGMRMDCSGKEFRVSAGSFFQVNSLVAAVLKDIILETLPMERSSQVIELYGGLGFFSAFIAPRVGRLAVVESSPYACMDFEVNLDEFEVELYEAPVEKFLPLAPFTPDALLADPPRTGISRDAMEEIMRLRPKWLAMVSCDPATLGRDAKALGRGGYRLNKLVMVDMFPQTYHIESFSLWACE